MQEITGTKPACCFPFLVLSINQAALYRTTCTPTSPCHLFLHSHPTPTAQESSQVCFTGLELHFDDLLLSFSRMKGREPEKGCPLALCLSMQKWPFIDGATKAKMALLLLFIIFSLSMTAGPNTVITASHMCVNGLHDIAFTDFYVPLHSVTFWLALLACISNYLAIS